MPIKKCTPNCGNVVKPKFQPQHHDKWMAKSCPRGRFIESAAFILSHWSPCIGSRGKLGNFERFLWKAMEFIESSSLLPQNPSCDILGTENNLQLQDRRELDRKTADKDLQKVPIDMIGK